LIVKFGYVNEKAKNYSKKAKCFWQKQKCQMLTAKAKSFKLCFGCFYMFFKKGILVI